MKRLLNFIIRIIREFIKHDLIAFAGDMTFKLILSMFALIIFAFSFIGFLRIDTLTLDFAVFMESIQGAFPTQVVDIIDNFILEVIDTRSGTVMSASIVVTLYSASSGFASVIKAINITYGQRDTRGWIRRRLLSVLLVLLFVVVVILAMGMMVFSNTLVDLIHKYIGELPFLSVLFGLVGYFTSIFIILFILIMIYKIASAKKVKILDVLPGACVTVIFWILFSKLYNIYLENYSQYTVIYGSIGSILILLIWLNFITAFLLVGSEVNALLTEDYVENRDKKVL